MRLTILAFVFVLFFAALASAAEPELADEALTLKFQRDQARLQLAQKELAASIAAIVQRHKLDLAAGDDFDPETRVIKRAPKKDVKK